MSVNTEIANIIKGIQQLWTRRTRSLVISWTFCRGNMTITATITNMWPPREQRVLQTWTGGGKLLYGQPSASIPRLGLAYVQQISALSEPDFLPQFYQFLLGICPTTAEPRILSGKSKVKCILFSRLNRHVCHSLPPLIFLPTHYFHYTKEGLN